MDEACSEAPAALPPPEPKRPHQHGKGRAGAIEIALPNGTCVSVDAFVNEKALLRVLRAMRGAT
jgi:transposase